MRAGNGDGLRRLAGSNPAHGVMSELTDDLNGAPEPIVERFRDAEPVFDGEADRLVEEYMCWTRT